MKIIFSQSSFLCSLLPQKTLLIILNAWLLFYKRVLPPLALYFLSALLSLSIALGMMPTIGRAEENPANIIEKLLISEGTGGSQTHGTLTDEAGPENNRIENQDPTNEITEFTTLDI